MSEKLLPCPFCGGEATIQPNKPKIFCKAKTLCRLNRSTIDYGSVDEAIQAWNIRPSLPQNIFSDEKELCSSMALAYMNSEAEHEELWGKCESRMLDVLEVVKQALSRINRPVFPIGLIIYCSRCDKQITEPGALFFHAPEASGMCKKEHICNECSSVSYLQNLPKNEHSSESCSSDEHRWQPIETAPKTGEHIIATQGGETIILGWEADGKETTTGEAAWVTGSMNDAEKYFTFHPTHWQKLPLSPTKK